jgi:hypothetical protein
VKTGSSKTVRKLTSESFSSENDISKSLEIIYVEPEVNQTEMIAHYRMSSPGVDQVKEFQKRKPSYTQLKRPLSTDPANLTSRSNSPTDKGSLSESDMPITSSSSEPYEMATTTQQGGNDFTPYVSDIEPLLCKTVTSPTKIIRTSSPMEEPQFTEEILSPILSINSSTPVRSPEKKFEYVEGKERHTQALAHLDIG